MQLGQYVRTRRENMDMSLSALSRQMGGSPGPSFLSRVESGTADISPGAAVKFADALGLPRPVLLNAAGYATVDQVDNAFDQLGNLVGAPAPILVSLPMIDAEHPDAEAVRVQPRMMRRREDAFLIGLLDRENEPYVGEAIVSRERRPREGQAVVAVVNGKAGAWIWHTGRPTGDYLSRDNGQRVGKGFQVLGVIISVTSVMEYGE